MAYSVERERLANFEAALLDLLAQGLPADMVQGRLMHDEAFVAYRDYAQNFEPRMLEVAAALVKKWGKRNAGGENVPSSCPE